MFITILPSYVASMRSYVANLMLLVWTPMYSYVLMYPYVIRMYSCGVLVAIVAYKTSHRPMVFVITLENPRKRNTRTAKKTLDILLLHGWCTKEEEAKRNTQFIDI